MIGKLSSIDALTMSGFNLVFFNYNSSQRLVILKNLPIVLI